MVIHAVQSADRSIDSRDLRQSWPSTDRASAGNGRAAPRYASERDRDLALEAGFDRHVAKPVEHAHLFEIIAELMGNATTPPPPAS